MTRQSFLDPPIDKNAPLGTEAHARAIAIRTKASIDQVENDAMLAALALKNCEDERIWKVLGYPSYELFLTKEVKVDLELADALRHAKRGQTVGAVRKALAEKARANPVGKQGAPTGNKNASKESDQQNKVDVVNFEFKGGNQASYLLSRLARDNPEILAAFERGEYRSVRSAAIAAGIIKELTSDEKAVKAFSKAENRLCVLKSIFDELSDTERTVLKEWLQ